MVQLLKKILGWLNIHPDNNQKWLLLSIFISGLLGTYIHPCLMKEIITALPSEWIAFESLFGSISGLIIGMLWQGKIRHTAIKLFLILCISESIIGCLLGMYLCFVAFNVWVFAICSLVYTSFISIFISKCIMAFRAKLWIEKDREIYDNNSSIVMGMICIIGFTSALCFMPSLKVSLFLWGLCCVFDDIGWIIVYIKNRNVLKNIE